MKKLLLGLVMSVMLISNAQAGILVLTGDIGNKFDGYKTVGWVLVILTGATIVGLVIDGEEIDNSQVKLELNDASLDLLNDEIALQTEGMDEGVEAVIKVNEDVASQIVALEGLTGTFKGQQLFHALTK
ncbi:MAG: hypothetical protein VX341_09925 [Bdellovibrionota bacterium]|nr:hypothetical protein [Bdellovibrionota bacterium]